MSVLRSTAISWSSSNQPRRLSLLLHTKISLSLSLSLSLSQSFSDLPQTLSLTHFLTFSLPAHFLSLFLLRCVFLCSNRSIATNYVNITSLSINLKHLNKESISVIYFWYFIADSISRQRLFVRWRFSSFFSFPSRFPNRLACGARSHLFPLTANLSILFEQLLRLFLCSTQPPPKRVAAFRRKSLS